MRIIMHSVMHVNMHSMHTGIDIMHTLMLIMRKIMQVWNYGEYAGTPLGEVHIINPTLTSPNCSCLL